MSSWGASNWLGFHALCRNPSLRRALFGVDTKIGKCARHQCLETAVQTGHQYVIVVGIDDGLHWVDVHTHPTVLPIIRVNPSRDFHLARGIQAAIHQQKLAKFTNEIRPNLPMKSVQIYQ